MRKPKLAAERRKSWIQLKAEENHEHRHREGRFGFSPVL
jgi:hypothetical protein